MKLRELRDRLSLGQIFIAAVAVVLGDGMQWWSFIGFIAFSAWAFTRSLPLETTRASQRGWTLLILVALLLTAIRVLLLAEFLDAGVDFLLLLVVQRLFNRQKAREHLQLLMLGVLLMVVGAVVNTGLSYPILFGLYLVVAVMTLIVNHLMSEAERLGPRVRAEVDRAAMRSRRTLWRAAASVSAVAATGALLVFLVFPRWGAGVFLRGAMARDAQSGFSGDVRLGGFGTIKTDSTVVARIKPLTPTKPVERVTWHLRGSALDRYQQGRWTHGKEAERTPLTRMGSYDALSPDGVPMLEAGGGLGRSRSYRPRSIPGFSASSNELRARIILEDLGVDVLFAASQPVAVRIEPRGALERRIEVRGGLNREIRVDKPPGPIQYEFVSRIGEPTPGELRAVGDPDVDPSLQPFLQRSEELSEEFSALAQRITRDATTRYDKVDAVVEYLSGFEYSLQQQTSFRVEQGADPVEGFVFDTRSGHCEYFASALALLLREVGVPTRIVNGYYGAHYNALGDFYAVRQADAHSWVEVWFDDLGWVTFDPTPPSGRTAGHDAQSFPALSQAFDALRNAYLEYVIDYDLGKQMALLENLGVRRSETSRRLQIAWKTVGAWAGGVALIACMVFLLRRQRRPKPPLEVRLYAQLLSALSEQGHDRQPGESATRFARRLVQAEVPGASAFEDFARLYETIRFGPGANESDRQALRTAAKQTLRQV